MYYEVKLDKMRNFKYGMRAMSMVEKKFKKSIAKIDMDDLTMEEMAVLLWAGLAHEDRDLTPEKVMDLVDEYSNVKTVMEAMGQAFSGAFGIEEKNEGAIEEGKNE